MAQADGVNPPTKNGEIGPEIQDNKTLPPLQDGEDMSRRPAAQSAFPEETRVLTQQPSNVSYNSIGGAPALPVVEERPSLLSRVKAWNPALTLENTGSVARDHLASERTWLAYVRTSLAISSSGVALVQLFTIAANRSVGTEPFSSHIQRFARPLGATTVLIGLAVCLLGVYRYFLVQSTLTKGLFPTARLEVHAISITLGALTAIVFGVLVAFPR